MITWYGIIGFIAAVCIAIYMMPQLIKIIKTKDTVSISILMVSLATFGDLCFMLNGIGILAAGQKNNISAGLPILLANTFGFLISGVILFFKIRALKWAKKFNIKEDQIPNHYKEIKATLKKTRAEKKLAKAKEKESSEITEIKKETPANSDSETAIG